MKLLASCLPQFPERRRIQHERPGADAAPQKAETPARPSAAPQLPARPCGRADTLARVRPPSAAPRHLVDVWRAQGGQVRCAGRSYPHYDELLRATRRYFAEPRVAKEARDPCTMRESGYAQIDPTRERLFVRAQLPEHHPLARALLDFHAYCCALARECLVDTAQALGLDAHALVDCVSFAPGTSREPSENIVRVFRYVPADDVPSGPGVLTPAHRDLGLMAIGLRSAPGLEAFVPTRGWCAVEAQARPPEPLLLTGRSLALLTHGAIDSCHHRVSAPVAERYSWVFHLRLEKDVRLTRERLSSPLLQPLFTELEGICGGEVTRRLYSSTFNANGPDNQAPSALLPYDQKLLAQERMARATT